MDCSGMIILRRLSKTRDLSKQTERDKANLMQRRRELGERYDHMERDLTQFTQPKMTRPKLFTLAAILRQKGIVQNELNRLCRRNMEGIICWFCDNLPQPEFLIANLIPEIELSPLSNPTADDPLPQVDQFSESYMFDDFESSFDPD
jgi:hypothetical protein